MQEEIAQAIFKKAFNGNGQNGMMYLIQLTDPTRIWSPYGRFGIFGQTYLFPDIGFVVGYGETAVRLNCESVCFGDMLGSIMMKTERHEYLYQLVTKLIGDYPSDINDRKAWYLKLIEFCSSDVLKIGIQCALSCSMKKLFGEIIDQYRYYFPDERPSFADELRDLPLTDYCQLFDVRLAMLITEKLKEQNNLESV